jgi:hypothetical protein
MRRYRGLFRPLGAFTRAQFSADYTISMFGFNLRQGQARLVAERQDRKLPSGRNMPVPASLPMIAWRARIGSIPTHGRSGWSPSRRSWSISKGSCSGFLADERLRSPFQRARFATLRAASRFASPIISLPCLASASEAAGRAVHSWGC